MVPNQTLKKYEKIIQTQGQTARSYGHGASLALQSMKTRSCFTDLCKTSAGPETAPLDLTTIICDE